MLKLHCGTNDGKFHSGSWEKGETEAKEGKRGEDFLLFSGHLAASHLVCGFFKKKTSFGFLFCQIFSTPDFPYLPTLVLFILIQPTLLLGSALWHSSVFFIFGSPSGTI